MAINYETQSNVSVVMPKELHEQLKIIAKKNKRSVSAEICYIIEKSIEKELEATT